MPRSRYKFYEPEYAYFLTCSVVGWTPLFSRPEIADIVLESWRFLQRERGLELYAYVIMEDHLHMVARSAELSKDIKDFKSYTARQIVEALRKRRAGWALQRLQQLKAQYKKESRFQVWQEGTHPEQIQGMAMMRQKVEYLHNNPLRRGYVDRPEHWRYSSARDYLGQKGLIEVITTW